MKSFSAINIMRLLDECVEDIFNQNIHCYASK